MIWVRIVSVEGNHSVSRGWYECSNSMQCGKGWHKMIGGS